MRRGRTVARGVGGLLVILGVVLVLITAWELAGTGLATDREQRAVDAQLERTWSGPETAPAPLRPGDPVARIRIPSLGPTWSFVVLEGTDQAELADGPGHYLGTALPGETGNVAIAGHRVGHGGPFDRLGALRSCDAIDVETRDAVLTYRVLPMPGEAGSWATSRTRRAECAGVGPLSGPYRDVVGRQIVTPADTQVIAPVPGRPEVGTPSERLLTLTTCHPRFSDRQRLIVHAVLTATVPKHRTTSGA